MVYLQHCHCALAMTVMVNTVKEIRSHTVPRLRHRCHRERWKCMSSIRRRSKVSSSEAQQPSAKTVDAATTYSPSNILYACAELAHPGCAASQESSQTHSRVRSIRCEVIRHDPATQTAQIHGLFHDANSERRALFCCLCIEQSCRMSSAAQFEQATEDRHFNRRGPCKPNSRV